MPRRDEVAERMAEAVLKRLTARKIVELNPITGLVETWRWMMLEGYQPHLPAVGIALAYLPYTVSVGGDFMGLHRFIMPLFVIATGSTAWLSRVMRANLMDVLNQQYIQTARAKGLSEPRVVRVHAVKNALIPVVTIIGLQMGRLLGGAVVVETIFSWPGLGKWAVEGIFHRDMPVVRAFILLMGVIFALSALYYTGVSFATNTGDTGTSIRRWPS